MNSPPLSMEQMRGKGVVLWFFEEGCPRCRAKWPELYEIERKFQSEPVKFIAVNSGSTRNELESYLQQVKCKWPVVCDQNRSFEKACGVLEISLNNIMQCYLITADGILQPGSWSDIEGTARTALRGAKWSIDQSKVPGNLKEVAKDIEFGVYPSAIDRLKREFNKSESRSQSQYLIDVVKQQASAQAQLIESSLDKLKPEMSYRRILVHEQTFRGIPLPKTLAGIKTELSQSAEVKAMLSKSK